MSPCFRCRFLVDSTRFIFFSFGFCFFLFSFHKYIHHRVEFKRFSVHTRARASVGFIFVFPCPRGDFNTLKSGENGVFSFRRVLCRTRHVCNRNKTPCAQVYVHCTTHTHTHTPTPYITVYAYVAKTRGLFPE